ncbi:MAG: uracil-DNA glycosylase, partial [Rhodospirillales bacterium]
KLMLIGEAPGAEEDRRGLPFVGPSGKLLDQMLGAIGLTRADVYITNTIYWRPPGNRTPTPEERNATLPFLLRQIELVAPKVVVPLGGPATQSLLNEAAGITRLRGRWIDFQTRNEAGGLSIPALPTFHPAFLLRQPAQKKQVWQDLRAIRARLRE